MSEGMFVITPDRKRPLVNAAYFRIYGFEPDSSPDAAEKIGSLLERYDISGRLLPLEEQPASLALRGETVVQREVRVRRVDTGREVITSVNCMPVRDASGKVVMAVITVEDITAHKQTEQRIAHIASFPELNPNPIFETDLEGKVTYANPAAHKLIPDLVERGANHPLLAGWPSLLERLRGGAEQTIARDIETDGRVFQQLIHYFPELGRIRVYFTDITERKKGEEARARLAAIVESSADAIISKTLDGIVSSWNQSAERFFGYSAEEIIGQPITLIIPPDRHDEEPSFLERLRRGECIDHYETVRMDKSGRY
jgi:PAS domain S-box-containing protein